MEMERNYNALLDMVKQLSTEDQSALADQIMHMLAETGRKEATLCSSLVENVRPEKPDCPHCAAKATLGFVVKRGLCKGSQRYFCKACGRYFVPTTNTAFARSRKPADTWRKFIGLTIAGKGLHVCASECGIAYQTAFTWRHKVLNAFSVNQKSTCMTGSVEVDEMLIPVSYKGNHIKGKFNEKRIRTHGYDNCLPRPSYRRGTDNKPKSPTERACVFCMIEDGNKTFYASVPGVGFMNETMLERTISRHIEKSSALVLADNYRTTRKYLEDNGYRYMILASNTSDNPNEHKPEVRGGYHIQHVNAMHRHIRQFLARYCGVSTKYLENYVALFVWLKSFALQAQKHKMNKISVARAAEPDCYMSRRDILARPAVPGGVLAA